jgi:predicted nucleic acid-binding protein
MVKVDRSDPVSCVYGVIEPRDSTDKATRSLRGTQSDRRDAITAVDTSVLLDVFGADQELGHRSAAALRTCLAEGLLVACAVVWAETAASFDDACDADAAMTSLRVTFSKLDEDVVFAATNAWREHRAVGGPHKRITVDFLIGAHALLRADRLLTREPDLYRRHFRELTIFDPSA